MSHQEPAPSSTNFDKTKLADFDSSPRNLKCMLSEDPESYSSNYPCEEAVTFNKLEEPDTFIQHVDERIVASPNMRMDREHLSCPKCSKSFAWKGSLVKHLKIHSGEKPFICDICSKAFTRKDDLKRHLRIHSRKNEFKCEICGKSYIHKYLLTRHMVMHSQNHVCHVCHKFFLRSANLKRHMITHSEKTEFKCNLCSKTFKLKHYFTMHMSKHSSGEFNCELCDRSFASVKNKQQHVRESHSAASAFNVRAVLPTSVESSKRVKREKRALNTFINAYFEPLEEMQGDFILFFEEVAPHLQSKLNEELYVMRAIKWYGVVKATLVRFSEDGEEEHATPYFRSDVLLELTSDTTEGHIQEAFSKIKESFEEFVQRGSGWTLEKIEHFELCIAKYQPL